MADHPVLTAQRLAAKRMAWDIAACAFELIGAAFIIGCVTLLCVGVGPDLAGWLR